MKFYHTTEYFSQCAFYNILANTILWQFKLKNKVGYLYIGLKYITKCNGQTGLSVSSIYKDIF